jgi:transcriptional regulator with XRE-family HTH domain
MAMIELKVSAQEIVWTPRLIRKLRGKRTQAEFGKVLGVPKNTVWRWEAGQAAPVTLNAHRLSDLAAEECFPQGWRLAGSLELRQSLEASRTALRHAIRKSLARSARELRE